MHTLHYVDYWQVLARHHLAPAVGRGDRGAVSTEMAVVTAAFVAIAIAGGVIFMNRAESNANNIPATVDPPAGSGVAGP